MSKVTPMRVLLKRLKEIAHQQKLTHAEIAKRAGTLRTRVTAILNDDLKHVSSDLLIRILAGTGSILRYPSTGSRKPWLDIRRISSQDFYP